MCAFLAFDGSDGKRSSCVYKYWIVDPSGNLTDNGVVVICLLMCGILMEK